MSNHDLQPTPAQTGEHGLVSTEDAASQGLATREQASIQSAIISAKRFPRSEEKAFEACMALSKRPTFASSAIYSRPQGGQNIEGPSVQLARALAQKWGNMRVSCNVLPSEEGWCHIEVTAIDLETNMQTQAQDRFPLRVYRKRDGWIDLSKSSKGFVEQEKRNLLNRKTAFCERSAILKLLPPDVIEDVMNACRKTSFQAASGELKASPKQVQRALIDAFGTLSVSVEMLEKKLGHPLHDMDGEGVAMLRTIFKSIKDGAASRDDHFSTGDGQTKAADDMNAQIKAKADAQEVVKEKADPTPTEDPAPTYTVAQCQDPDNLPGPPEPGYEWTWDDSGGMWLQVAVPADTDESAE